MEDFLEELWFNRPHWQTGLSTFLPKICKIVFLFAIDRMCQVISMMNKYVNFASCTANPFLEGYSISIRIGIPSRKGLVVKEIKSFSCLIKVCKYDH